MEKYVIVKKIDINMNIIDVFYAYQKFKGDIWVKHCNIIKDHNNQIKLRNIRFQIKNNIRI